MPKKKARKSKNQTVSIEVKNGVLTYSAKNKTVRSGDRLEWTCDKGYAIHFERNVSPFAPNKPSLGARAGRSTGYRTIRGATKRVHHKYFVAVYVRGDRPILTDDPQIIIDNNG